MASLNRKILRNLSSLGENLLSHSETCHPELAEGSQASSNAYETLAKHQRGESLREDED